MKTYIIVTPNNSFAQVQAKSLTDLFHGMIEVEMIETQTEFDKLVIIEGEFVKNDPFK